ncbi:MAG: hypothetical protein Kow0020_12310 [Wenzhouxiangellaceae bacterium]
MRRWRDDAAPNPRLGESAGRLLDRLMQPDLNRAELGLIRQRLVNMIGTQQAWCKRVSSRAGHDPGVEAARELLHSLEQALDECDARMQGVGEPKTRGRDW